MGQAEVELALADAFRELEACAAEGRIGAYGIQLNELSLDPGAPFNWAQLLRILRQAVGVENHFGVLEIPLNLYERQAFDDQGALLKAIEEEGCALLAARPLSAFTERGMFRLKYRPEATREDLAGSLKSARYRVASLEAEFDTQLAPSLRIAKLIPEGPPLRVAAQLGPALERAESLEQFELAETTLFTPKMKQVFAHFDQAFKGPQAPSWQDFHKKYLSAVGLYLSLIRQSAWQKNCRFLEKLIADLEADSDLAQRWHATLSSQQQLNSSQQEKPRDSSSVPHDLAERALRWLTAAAGPSAGLVGSRRPEDVELLLQVAKEPKHL